MIYAIQSSRISTYIFFSQSNSLALKLVEIIGIVDVVLGLQNRGVTSTWPVRRARSCSEFVMIVGAVRCCQWPVMCARRFRTV
jgi:hypothetical protein